ncbi:NAD(P)-dependent alcohol dehydrogenase [Spelaeicoccus albus]|uniref:L-iditol 2-dehydrogenase n=1 Tax=Spelaeicoccus albus TaxID=1280376 RepID=A0A7Z0D2G4_9MICO|nr:L-iditol 2-dehydrogenase [Spelaeicoccus albus]
MPSPAAGEVLIEVLAVGVCGSDIHYYEHGRIGDLVVRSPLVLGHEASGRVVALGDGVRSLAVGDRVALEPGVPCGACRECRSGRYNLCPDVRFFATPPIDGTFAEFVTLPADFAHRVPDSLSDVEAALIEPLSVGLWSNQKADVGPGDTVLVTGAGPIGLLALQVAKARGAASVVVTDVVDTRLDVASELGADDVVNVRTSEANLADLAPSVLIECSGVPSSVAAGLRALRPAGRAVLVGMSADPDVSIPVATLQNRELTLTGTFRYANVYPAAIGMARQRTVNLARLGTHEFGLDDVEAALTASAADPSVIKPIVRPGR